MGDIVEAILLREMLEDSPLGYIKFKGIKTKDIFTSIEIIDTNKSYTELVKRYNKDGKPNLMESLFTSTCININSALQYAVENRKYTTIEFIKELNTNYKIDFYSGENDEFYCRFNELHLDSYHLSETLKNSPFISWTKNRQGKYLDINNKFKEFVDKDRSEIIGKTDYDIWNKRQADIFAKQDEKVMLNKRLDVYFEHIEYGDNCKKYYQTSKWPYVDDDNLVIGTIGVTTEITDKIQIQESIRKNEEIFLELANNIDDIIFTMDEEKILYISPSFENIYGFKPTEISEDINEWFNYWDEIEFLEEPKPYSYKGIAVYTYRIVKNDLERWLTCKTIPVYDEYGNVNKRIGMVSDITKDKQLQEQLEQLRLDFFANLSHELRTPINLVLSGLEVIKLRMNNLSSEDYDYFDKYLGIINQNGLRLLKLVNNLIDTTKIDSGHFSYEPKNYDIISFIENICMSVSDFIEQNNMHIIFDTNVEEKILSFDLDNMERIILNLLSNAIKFNKMDGSIAVTISCEDDIKISVKDDGIGIPKDKIDSIFGRFEQVKSRTKKDAEGSGIGLSLVKSLVEMHGGSIEVFSQLGEGSEFIITLPDIVRDYDDIEEFRPTYNNVNMMKVEFSDIY